MNNIKSVVLFVVWTLIGLFVSFVVGYSLGCDSHAKTATGEQLQIQQDLRQQIEQLKNDLKVKQGDFLDGMVVESQLRNVIEGKGLCVESSIAEEIKRQGYEVKAIVCNSIKGHK